VPPGYDIVALAASAGGLKALTDVLAGLGTDFPAPLVVVQHLDPRHRSLMAEILGRRTALPAKEAVEGDRISPGHIYVAPPNRHLLVNADGTLSLTQSELVHFVRPSADLLFESTAAAYRERAIAVVLSGSGKDGSMGVKAIKKMGGTVIVQDEKTAEFVGMPEAARETGAVDFVLPLSEIAAALLTLVKAK
jgi:two-component system, chemotaxis family, protein-glutamate methylesterase/glutaminase